MLILGIETSCDETAVSLLEVKNGKIKVLSNAISSQVKLHAKYGGVVPSLAAREHVKNLPKVLKLALGKLPFKKIDLIAVTKGPGLISSLLVGTTFAKTLAWKYKKPIVGVNHLEGHIHSNWLKLVGVISNFQFPISNENSKPETRNQKLETSAFPALCLIVSGGHTELVLMQDFGKYKIVGQTLDDAAGEAFDKIARILGLGYPGGPAISAEAEKLVIGKRLLVIGKNKKSEQLTTNNQELITKLPRPMLNSKDFNFSFAGLKTAVLYLVRNLLKDKKIKKLNIQIRNQIAAESQRAIADVLVTKTVRAAQKYKTKTIMLSGGVSANKFLRTELEKVTAKMNIKFFKPEIEYATDNAAMIALAGYWQIKRFGTKSKELGWRNVKVDANLELM